MALLSVNVNKIALIRNSRGADFPNLLHMSQEIIKYGGQGITIHPRPDERHARYSDAQILKDNISTELNIEGNPTEKFLDMVCEVKPAQCTLVPDAPDAITSDSGWDCINNLTYLQDVCGRLKSHGIRVSIFLDPKVEQVEYAVKTGTDRIELYTEEYASTFGTEKQDEAFGRYKATAEAAASAGLQINAGHDLNLENLTFFQQNIPNLDEVSIGHALVIDMMHYGMEETIKRYLNCLK